MRNSRIVPPTFAERGNIIFDFICVYLHRILLYHKTIFLSSSQIRLTLFSLYRIIYDISSIDNSCNLILITFYVVE